MSLKNLNLEECSPQYWEFVRHLRNHMKESFDDQSEINDWQHLDFMCTHSHNYRIVTLLGHPIGFVGHAFGDIRIAIHPEHQGKGYAKWALLHFLDSLPPDYRTTTIRTQIKIDNEASRRLFASCGFKEKMVKLSLPTQDEIRHQIDLLTLKKE